MPGVSQLDRALFSWTDRFTRSNFLLPIMQRSSVRVRPPGNNEVWLSLVERSLWERDAAGSNPVTSTICRYSLMVEHQPSKLNARVRFPLPAPLYCGIAQLVARLFHRQNVAGSSPAPATICCRGGIGIRERLKHAFIWIRAPAAIPKITKHRE